MANEYIASGTMVIDNTYGLVRGHLEVPLAFGCARFGTKVSVEIKHINLPKGKRIRVTIEAESDETNILHSA